MFKKVVKYRIGVTALIGIGLILGVVSPIIGLGILFVLSVTLFVVDMKSKLSGEQMP